MRKSLLAAIMAASALIPAAAFAQDEGDRPHRGEGRERPAAASQGRPQGQRPEQAAQPQARPAAPEVRAQAQVQAPAPAPAQPQAQRFQRPDRGGRPDFQGGRPDWQGRGPGRPDAQGGPARITPQGQPVQGQPPRGAYDGRRDGQPGYNGGQAQRGGDPRGYGRPDDRRGYGNGYNGGYNGGYNANANRAWNRDWRRDNRYNYNAYRSQNRNAYHLPRYYAPYGWDYGYRRFSIGFTLSSVLFDENYWIDDTDYYRLPPAYGPYRWVRYYNDALLVDIRSGYVVDTVYDIFW